LGCIGLGWVGLDGIGWLVLVGLDGVGSTRRNIQYSAAKQFSLVHTVSIPHELGNAHVCDCCLGCIGLGLVELGCIDLGWVWLG
jgi:hypothetical protein